MIGYAFCGSFCTHKVSLSILERLLQDGYEIQPIMSETVYGMDTKFGSCEELKDKVTTLCGREIIHTIVGAEPLGPQIRLDALVISPCTGNTLSKIALGITDTSVTMAVKAHLRNEKPVLLALATNDALGATAKNIGLLHNTKNIFFVPYSQDDPYSKQKSLVCDFSYVPEAVECALKRQQMQPLFLRNNS